MLTVKYKTYLEHMHCDEVVLSEEYTRFLLANATVFSGITKVVSKLLNNDEGDTLKLEPLPDDLINQSFSEVVEAYKTNRHAIVIGIVENMGSKESLNKMRCQKLRKPLISANWLKI